MMKDAAVFEKLWKQLEIGEIDNINNVFDYVLEFGIQNLLDQDEQQAVGVVQQLLRVGVDQYHLVIPTAIVVHLADAGIKFPLPAELWECYASIGEDHYEKIYGYAASFSRFRGLVDVTRAETLQQQDLKRLATLAETTHNIGIAMWLLAYIDTASVDEADRIAVCEAFDCANDQAERNWQILSEEAPVTCVELYHKFKTSKDLDSEYFRLLSELSSEHGLIELANYYLLHHYLDNSEISELSELADFYILDDYREKFDIPFFEFIMNVLEDSDLSEDAAFKRFDLYSQSEPLKKAIQDGVVTTLEECEKICPTESVKKWTGKI